MDTKGHPVNVRMFLHISQEVHAEFIEPKVHNRYTVGHIFQVNDFFLKLFQLGLTVGKIAFFLQVNGIIITGRGKDRNTHTRFDAIFEVDVFIQVQVRPEINELNRRIFTADTVDTAKALDDTDRIPMNIVVYAIITVLQVLPFRDAVCTDKNIDIPIFILRI